MQGKEKEVYDATLAGAPTPKVAASHGLLGGRRNARRALRGRIIPPSSSEVHKSIFSDVMCTVLVQLALNFDPPSGAAR